MGQIRPIFLGLVGMGVMGVVAAVVVPLTVIAVRDRGEGELAPRPTSTPVMQGVSPGGVLTPLPQQDTPTPAPATPTPTVGAVEPTATATAATATPTAPPSGGAAGDPAAGQQVFGSAAPIACSVCHSLDGAPGLGPSLQGIAGTAATRVSGLSAEEYIRESITTPTAFLVEGFSPVMPTT
ncbi:MAG: hypothetical protein V3U26_00805, partial [Dehalococcoidia bacterium]